MLQVNKPAADFKRGHVGILDLLRGIAAISVVFYHFTYLNLLSDFRSPLLNKVFEHGNLGVEMFFVISGFVIPYSLYGTGYRIADFGRYMVKRVVRICPPAYASVLLQLVKWKAIDILYPAHQSPLVSITLGQIIRNLTFTYGFGDSKQINVVFWTLSVEFIFYVFIGIFYNELFSKKNILLFLLIFFLPSFIGLLQLTSDHSFFAYSSLFALGGVTLLFYRGSIKLVVYLLLLGVFFAISIGTIGFLASMVGVGTALTIAFVKGSNKVFAFLGKISFSLYLTHNLLGSIANFLLAKFLHVNTEIEAIAVVMLCALLACLFAYLFALLIENPFLRLARRMKV